MIKYVLTLRSSHYDDDAVKHVFDIVDGNSVKLSRLNVLRYGTDEQMISTEGCHIPVSVMHRAIAIASTINIGGARWEE